MVQKERTIEDPAEALAILGINPDTAEGPGGAPVTTEEPPAAVPAEPEPAITMETDTSEPTEPPQPPAPEQMTEEQRRTWQSEADTHKAKSELLQRELDMMKQQNQALFNQTQQMQQVVQPFVEKYQPSVPQSGPVEPQPDYEEDGYINTEKLRDYQRRVREYDKASLKQELLGELDTAIEQRENRTTLSAQVDDLITEFPEYVNPLTGQPDKQRIERDLKSYTSKKSMTDLIREMKGQPPKGSQPKTGLEESLRKIEENANRPQSVTATGETVKESPKVDKRLIEIGEMYGHLDLPPGFEGVE